MLSSELVLGRRRLAGSLFAPESVHERAPGLLFVHGRGSNRVGYAHRARSAVEELGAVCLTVDLTAHGESPRGMQPPTMREHLEDVTDAYDVLAASAGVDAQRIGVCGASYGAYLAGRLAPLRPVRRLLLRAPALYDDQAFSEGRDSHTSATANATDYFLGIRNSGCDVLVVESENDEEVPHSVIEAYLRGCPDCQHELIPDALHGLTKAEWDAQFVGFIISWFSAI